jgi:hypothetical protein
VIAGNLRRYVVPLVALTAIALIAVWFPFRTLLAQSAQLDSTSHQIAVIEHQRQSLAAQQRVLSTTEAATLLARQEYQLVSPGQRIVQILTNPNSGSMSTGDPGNAPLVAPTSAQGLIPVDPSAPANPPKPAGFWARVTRTLEFWR